MGSWIPGPARYCWPARPPETPHEAAIANREEEVKPRRTRRSKKTED